MTFKPMLAADCEMDTSKLRYPCLVSPKLDGIRCIIVNGRAMSRSMKPIPNRAVQAWADLHAPHLEGLDGELIVGSPTQKTMTDSDEGVVEVTVMSRTTSGVMKQDGRPDFTFYVFDKVMDIPFQHRLKAAEQAIAHVEGAMCRLKLVPHQLVANEEELAVVEAKLLLDGYEGVMTRDVDGAYKQGRSTMKQQGLVKVKRFTDSEAVVIGVEEMMHNENEAKKDAFGRTERSSSAAGLRPAGTMGSLRCRTAAGVEFNIGTGYTAETRAALWLDRQSLIGKLAKYKSFIYGEKDAPRFPVFLGFRAPEDMS